MFYSLRTSLIVLCFKGLDESRKTWKYYKTCVLNIYEGR